MRQKIALLGATGSIGEQTLEVVRAHPSLFSVRTLTASSSWKRLAEQAVAFDAEQVVIADERHYAPLRDALADTDIKVYAGTEALEQVAGQAEHDVVVNALVGYAGLRPTAAALRAGKKVALANKETLVCGGSVIMPMAMEHRAPLVPIDSEHSAILQCLVGEYSPIKRLLLTCSGGALRDWPLDRLERATAADALKHPRWRMGAKITIDSATLVNKAFEVIEAHWLFGVDPSKIEVVVHPESIVHSLVEFEDGALKAQLGAPDMKIPISYALSLPSRLPLTGAFDLIKASPLHFEAVDLQRFPTLSLACEVLKRGGTAGATMNGANEVAVEAFLRGSCRYFDIVRSIEYALARAPLTTEPSLDDLAAADAEARTLAAEFLWKS